MPEKECPICFSYKEHLISSEECNNRICKECMFKWYKKCKNKTILCPWCRNEKCFDASIIRPTKRYFLCWSCIEHPENY